MTDTFDYIEVDPEAAALEEELNRLRNISPVPLKRMVDDFRDGTTISRQMGEKGRRYYDNDQLDESMMRALKRARQPKVIRNEIKPAINGLLGVLQQAKVDPRAFPRNPNNEDQADVASKALRYVADANRLHKIKIDVAENHLIEGICAATVEVTGENGDVVINRIRYDEAIYDPRAREADFADALYLGVGKWMYEGDVAKLFPHFADDLAASFSAGWGSDLGLDRPDKPNDLSNNWLDKTKRRIFIVELYHREDQWMRSVFYVGGVLEQDVSPYMDDAGEPMCPIVMGSCYIDSENQRYGVTRSMLLPQDEVNAYASRALHLANSRQIRASDPDRPPEVDANTARIEAAKADGVIPFGYDIVPTGDLSSGIQVMLMEARQALIRQAPTPAVLAEASSASSSGRAKLVQQQAGMTEIARALGRLEDWENSIYRQIWLRLKQFKKEPWWVRITGDEGKQEFVGLNMPVMPGPDGQDQPIPPEMLQAMQAQGMQPPKVQNKLAEMDVDIEVETVPDTANLQAEQFESIAPLLPSLGQAIGPEAAFKVALALSSVPDKQYVRDIIDQAKGSDDPQAQQMAQMQQQIQQMMTQLQMQGAEADVRKKNADAELAESRARGEQADTVLKAAQFELGRDIDAS